jgi:hypothetical protein
MGRLVGVGVALLITAVCVFAAGGGGSADAHTSAGGLPVIETSASANAG